MDNDTREDCTLVKVCSPLTTQPRARESGYGVCLGIDSLCDFSQVDSVNRDGVLLEMVQLLTDLDLVISKSYISSDGGWLMDGKNSLLLCPFIFLVHLILDYVIIHRF